MLHMRYVQKQKPTSRILYTPIQGGHRNCHMMKKFGDGRAAEIGLRFIILWPSEQRSLPIRPLGATAALRSIVKEERTIETRGRPGGKCLFLAPGVLQRKPHITLEEILSFASSSLSDTPLPTTTSSYLM
jgi:hypothetical protein